MTKTTREIQRIHDKLIFQNNLLKDPCLLNMTVISGQFTIIPNENPYGSIGLHTIYEAGLTGWMDKDGLVLYED